MKSRIIFIVSLVIMILASCESHKIQKTSGRIEQVEDSVMLVAIDKYNISFNISKARFDNGAVMKDDSVVIHYIGQLREKNARALLVYLIPRQGTVVEAVYDPSKELVIDQNPLSEEQVKKLEKLAKSK